MGGGGGPICSRAPHDKLRLLGVMCTKKVYPFLVKCATDAYVCDMLVLMPLLYLSLYCSSYALLANFIFALLLPSR